MTSKDERQRQTEAVLDWLAGGRADPRKTPQKRPSDAQDDMVMQHLAQIVDEAQRRIDAHRREQQEVPRNGATRK